MNFMVHWQVISLILPQKTVVFSHTMTSLEFQKDPNGSWRQVVQKLREELNGVEPGSQENPSFWGGDIGWILGDSKPPKMQSRNIQMPESMVKFKHIF